MKILECNDDYNAITISFNSKKFNIIFISYMYRDFWGFDYKDNIFKLNSVSSNCSFTKFSKFYSENMDTFKASGLIEKSNLKSEYKQKIISFLDNLLFDKVYHKKTNENGEIKVFL